ncbi:MLP-like protein 31 isoform X2 [Gastrolobium bilobum]|uniref:MLP-like protein 31 isoform X2 n=1 Tax=Gastrolobium bilobum TaxID=150636 RepID=UPI002AB24336|nr:MLP-like protein 31 isoform X2 [Gastrolobium bilobum]
MALTGKITTEFGIKTPAAKFFNLFSKQLHHVQNITDRIHGGKVIQGDDWHGPDSVKHWSYTIGDIDQHYKIFKLNLQVIDKSGGGSTVKWTIEYEKINDNVEPPYGYLDHLTKLTKDSDDHLLGA